MTYPPITVTLTDEHVNLILRALTHAQMDILDRLYRVPTTQMPIRRRLFAERRAYEKAYLFLLHATAPHDD